MHSTPCDWCGKNFSVINRSIITGSLSFWGPSYAYCSEKCKNAHKNSAKK